MKGFDYNSIYVFRSAENSWRWEIAIFRRMPKKSRKHGQLACAWIKSVGNSSTQKEAREQAQEVADELGLRRRVT